MITIYGHGFCYIARAVVMVTDPPFPLNKLIRQEPF
jgi:hypothetical protein